jgi:hypothetical protein
MVRVRNRRDMHDSAAADGEGAVRRIGQAWLSEALGLRVPTAHVFSTVGPGARRTHETRDGTVEHYPAGYDPGEGFVANLRFALRYEPLDTGVLAAAFEAVGGDVVRDWALGEPRSGYARRAWFLYEALTGRTLDLPDAGSGTAYIDALSPTLNVGTLGRTSRRHKVVDNLLGVPGFCPSVRLTPSITATLDARLHDRAAAVAAGVPRDVLARAVRYLFTKETRSSFEIERERPSPQKAERFVAALERGGEIDPTDPVRLLELQNLIVDPRYAASGFRDFQNFVGESLGGYRERVHFVCPKPEDVGDLMAGWAGMTRRLRDEADPITAAALAAFGFVFIHPYEDGNGRLHRFMAHHVLAKKGFTPEGMIFPISASILRDAKGYDAVLEGFSKPLLDLMDWSLTPARSVQVNGPTSHLYRYFDATRQVEYLGEKIADTIDVDLREEIGFVTRYDRALAAVAAVVDMPDRRAALLARYIAQGDGILSGRKRGQFHEISDEEIAAMEEAFRDAVEDAAPGMGP